MNIQFSLCYYINAHLVKYIHTLINGNRNPQGGMLTIQNIILGKLALQIYNLIKYIFKLSHFCEKIS